MNDYYNYVDCFLRFTGPIPSKHPSSSSVALDDQSSVSSCQMGPQCRPGELGDDPVRGRLRGSKTDKSVLFSLPPSANFLSSASLRVRYQMPNTHRRCRRSVVELRRVGVTWCAHEFATSSRRLPMGAFTPSTRLNSTVKSRQRRSGVYCAENDV